MTPIPPSTICSSQQEIQKFKKCFSLQMGLHSLVQALNVHPNHAGAMAEKARILKEMEVHKCPNYPREVVCDTIFRIMIQNANSHSTYSQAARNYKDLKQNQCDYEGLKNDPVYTYSKQAQTRHLPRFERWFRRQPPLTNSQASNKNE